ncbi:hypothetical protein Ahy_A07g036264 [Arachis hypogaea]|uniref:Uncharacterized protein n=1 Tax=Arachis hypogaea TaxID=3818 RepID=A0A445CFR5_ARAHY|nr:hypothetical protein Ahy_A07g036264 [Arachis hypogaea]
MIYIYKSPFFRELLIVFFFCSSTADCCCYGLSNFCHVLMKIIVGKIVLKALILTSIVVFSLTGYTFWDFKKGKDFSLA